jgi:hypothetical protein
MICGEQMTKIPGISSIDFGFKQFTTENINGVPTTIMSTGHRKKLMKQYGLTEGG